MPKLYVFTIAFFIALLISSCSKKHHATRMSNNNIVTVKNNDSLIAKKVIKPKPKYVTPKVITVNDSVARKSVDGRLYHDLLGHRYWKNYKDGKYYLFNQSMYSNEAFKPK